jgi:hypothetical protein
MSRSTPSAGQLIATYLALPTSRRLGFVASLSRLQRQQLSDTLEEHQDAPTTEPTSQSSAREAPASAPISRAANAANVEAVLKQLRLEEESLMVQYDEHMHYWEPQETSVDRLLQKAAAAKSVQGEGPPNISRCRRVSRSLVIEIMDLFQSLNLLVLHHEALIRTRWRKKSRAQKEEILLAAWPNMARVHRPDMASYSPGSQIPPRKAASTRIWPYINLEDLLQPKAFLIYLNARARHSPDNFACFDLEMAPLYKLPKQYLQLRKDNFTMAFLGRSSREDYAELIEWPSEEEQLESLRAGRTIHVDHGLQILIIQRGILSFLAKCVRRLVEDSTIPKHSLIQLESSTLSDNTEGYPLLQIVAREAPYRLPTRLNLARLEVLASAQKRQAIEHAWGLREDPAYFADAVEQQRSHRIELILDLKGNAHEHSEDFPLYNKALRHMIMDAYCMVFMWDHISKCLGRLRGMADKYADIISLDSDLPKDFFDEFAETRFFLESLSLDLITMIKTYFPASPPLRKYYYRANPEAANKRTSLVVPRYTEYDEHGKSLRHMMCWIDMFGDKGRRGLFTLHVVMDELEHFMQTGDEAKALVSPFMASWISQLAIVTECLHQLHSFQPWAHKVESEIEKHKAQFSRRYDALLGPWSRIDQTHRSFEKRELCKLGSTRDGKFEYPADKRRTRVNVDKMRAAETALDKFWDAANSHWLRVARCTPGALIESIVGERTLYRTPVWEEPKQLEEPANNLSSLSRPVGAVPDYVHDKTKEFTGSFTKPAVPVKTKKKTRGPAPALLVEPEPVDPAARLPPQHSPPTYKVDKRSLKVFRSLFHSPDSPDQPGEVVWSDFLHAMVTVGFSAEKLQGSAWCFAPTTLTAERSIQFHEPHPNNRLPFIWARRYGRRLTRAFGWTSGSFELA